MIYKNQDDNILFHKDVKEFPNNNCFGYKTFLIQSDFSLFIDIILL